MTDDHDRVQQWLAEAIETYMAENSLDYVHGDSMAAAILDTPGVEVVEQAGFVLTTITDLGTVWQPAHSSWGLRPTHRRLVIMLPAESAQRSAEGAHINEEQT